jgi:uncharacterized protein (TIGR00251 family)
MILVVHVKPNARETKIISWRDRGTIIIAIKAPPVDGKANRELLRFLASKLGVPKTHLEIKRGQSGRVKQILLPDGADIKLLTPEINL